MGVVGRKRKFFRVGLGIFVFRIVEYLVRVKKRGREGREERQRRNGSERKDWKRIFIRWDERSVDAIINFTMPFPKSYKV